jgi:N6-L-threonylcarbamoyladenine synthase
MPDLCAGYQHAIIEQLASKTGAALDLAAYKSVGLSGGVANNRALRARLAQVAQQRSLPLMVAEPKHCGDNAGMIAFAAWADVGLPLGAAAVPAASLTVDQV